MARRLSLSALAAAPQSLAIPPVGEARLREVQLQRFSGEVGMASRGGKAAYIRHQPHMSFA